MSPDVTEPAGTTTDDDGATRTLGLPQATSLVVGTIIGVKPLPVARAMAWLTSASSSSAPTPVR